MGKIFFSYLFCKLEELKTREKLKQKQRNRASSTRLQAKAVLEPTAGANRKDEPSHGNAAL